MKQAKIVLLAVVALILGSTSFAAGSEKANLKATIKMLETANPKKDLEKAIKQGDWRNKGHSPYY